MMAVQILVKLKTISLARLPIKKAHVRTREIFCCKS